MHLKKTPTTVVLKTKDEDKKAANSLKEVGKVLEDIPIDKTKATKSGDLVIHIKAQEDVEKAVAKLKGKGEQLGVNTTVKDKVKPKIIVTNISDLESKEDITENIIRKNNWMGEMIKEGAEFTLVTELKSKRDSYKHFVFRCSPIIRKKIMELGNALFTQYSKCSIYDRYYVYQCYRCQRFGHRSQSCKANFEVCAKCSGRHKLENCSHNGRPCCANCKTDGKQGEALEHMASSRDCPRMLNEISKVTKITDHGY